jgi:bifunctional enzyme CysN/CysC
MTADQRRPWPQPDRLGQNTSKDLLRFSAVGAVDDGKSTLIGRLLHDTKAIYEDQLSALRRDSARIGRGSELDFALVTDGLRAEREQGITIDVAYRYFSTPKRHFIIADTPGHEQYTRNMATGASTANLAVILIDARQGVLTQTKRHSFIASLLGIPRLLIAVNKMDLVEYAQDVFEAIVAEYREFATRLGVAELKFVPIAALPGANVTEPSPHMPWYHGETVLAYLENVYIGGDRNLIDFRLPVQYVLRPHQRFRGFAGQIASGVLRRGDDMRVLPSMRASRVESILGFEGELEYAFAPMSVTVTLADDVDVSRGDMLVHARNLPATQADFEAMLVWMDAVPLETGRTYGLKHTTRLTKARVVKLEYKVDVNTLSRLPGERLQLNEIGRAVLETNHELFIDPYRKNKSTGSFILIDPETNGTVAAGMIIDRRPVRDVWAAAHGAEARGTRSRHVSPERSQVAAADREALLGQRAVTVWLTGLSGAGKSTIARELEGRLHERGRHCFILDGDNLRLGLNRDLGFSRPERSENIRRIAEVGRLLNDAGIVALVPVISPFRADREGARHIIGEERFLEVYVATPIEVCEARDAKGLYEKARAGEVPEFTGISSPYEPPEAPAVVVDTAERSVAECVEDLLRVVEPRLRR